MRTLKQDLEQVDLHAVELDKLLASLGIKTKAAREFARISLANTLLMDVKQTDYGSANIAKFGASGCVIRMSDKFERLCNLYRTKRRKPQNESLQDSFRDLSNYAIIALQCDLGLWPKE